MILVEHADVRTPAKLRQVTSNIPKNGHAYWFAGIYGSPLDGKNDSDTVFRTCTGILRVRFGDALSISIDLLLSRLL